MRNINSPLSSKKESSRITPNTYMNSNDSALLLVSEDLIDEAIKESASKKPIQIYYKEVSKGKRRSAHKYQARTINDLQFPRKMPEVENAYQSNCPNQYLISDNKKLKAEVEHVKKDNEVLKNENKYLKGCLGNLKAQLNHFCNSYNQVEDLVIKFKRENCYIHQKLAFSEQKLGEYVALVFNQDVKIQNLEVELSSIINKYEAKISALKFNANTTLSTLSNMNSDFQFSVQTLNSSVIVGKPKSQNLQVEKLYHQLNKLNLFISEAIDCLHNLFRDKWSEFNWKRAQSLFNEYTNSFMSGWIDADYL